MRLVGYARVSTRRQKLDLQVDALERAGVAPADLHTDKLSGATPNADRAGLQAALAQLHELRAAGEPCALVVWKLDRAGRDVDEIRSLVSDLADRGIGFRTLDGIDTTGEMGANLARFLLTILAAVAELLRGITRERVVEGMEAARARGVHVGRKAKLSPTQVTIARDLRAQGKSWREIGQVFNVSHTTVMRAVKP